MIRNMSVTPSLSLEVHYPENASQNMKEALKDLPRIARLAMHDTDWPLEGRIAVHAFTAAKDMRDHHEQLASQLIADIYTPEEIKTFKLTRPRSFQSQGSYHQKTSKHIPQIAILNFSPNTPQDQINYYKSTLYHEFIHATQLHNTESANHDYLNAHRLYNKAVYKYGKFSKKANEIGLIIYKVKRAREGQAAFLQIKNEQKTEYFPTDNKYLHTSYQHRDYPKALMEEQSKGKIKPNQSTLNIYYKYYLGSLDFNNDSSHGNNALEHFNNVLNDQDKKILSDMECETLQRSPKKYLTEIVGISKSTYNSFTDYFRYKEIER